MGFIKTAPSVQRGFTLIEIVVVMVLIGLAVGLTAVTAFPGNDRKLYTEADRLAQLWGMAYEDAQLTGATVVWEADAQSYRFLRREGETLNSIQNDSTLRERNWPVQPVQAALLGQAAPAEPNATVRLAFERNGNSDPFRIALRHEQYQVRIYGDGLGNFKVENE